MESFLPDTEPYSALVVGSFFALYFVLVLLCFQFRCHLYTRNQRKHYDDWIIAHWKHLFTANGLAVYPFLYFFQGLAVSSSTTSTATTTTAATIGWTRILLHIASIPYAVLLWDGGRIYGRNFFTVFLINLHHLAVFLALHYHITEHPIIAARTTRLFGWLWFVHALAHGIVLDRTTFDWIKEFYASVTVFLVHDYFCGESQPGFGWNYQTVSLVTLWVGRYGFNDNGTRVVFFRRIEVPGSIVVVLSSLFFERNLYKGVGATVCIYASILLIKSAFQDNRPGKWDPGHASIAKVLNEFEREYLASSNNTSAADMAAMEESIRNQEVLYTWKTKNTLALQQTYPMARAIIENNRENLNTIIKKGGDAAAKSIYQPMKELSNQTPGEMAVSLGRIRCVLLLITTAGLDPWEGDHCDGKSIWVVAGKLRVIPLLELKDRLEPIALDAYPPVSSSSIFNRAMKIIRSF